MPSTFRRPGSLLLILAPTALVWLLDLAGLLAPFDAVFEDSTARCLPSSASTSVLLIDWTPPSHPEAYASAIRQLESLGARQIAFSFLPHDAPPEFFREAARLDVVFGQTVGTSQQGRALPPLPPTAAGTELTVAAVCLPPTTRGIACRQRAWVGLDDRPIPLLEAELVRRLHPERPIPSEFGIRFRGGPGSVPLVSSQVLFDGKLVPELVRGRIVLLGSAGVEGTPGIWTPATTSEPLSLLEFQGQVIDGLASGHSIRPLAPGLRLGLCLFVASLSALLFDRFGVRRAIWVELILLAALPLGGVCSLWCGYWPGVLALVLTQFSCWLILCCDRAIRSSAVLRHQLLELTVQDRQWTRPTNFVESKDPWELLARLAEQSLEVTRQGFLDVVAGTNRLHEVAGQTGTRELIAQLGLDRSSPIYRETGEARAPRFFDIPGETIALVPLQFSERLFGYWLVGVRGSPSDDLRSRLDGFAEQIAHLLWQRREWQAERARHFVSGSEDDDQRAHDSAIDSLQRRLERAERLLGIASHPTLVSDPFGRIHQINSPMREWQTARGTDARNLPIVDWIASVTHQPTAAVQRLLSGVYRDHQRVALPVADASAGKHYLMYLHPLVGESAAGVSAPFGLDGLVCELVDVTAQTRLDLLREKMVGHLALAVRNDLAAVELAAGMLSSTECDAEERKQLGEIVTDKVRKVSATFGEAQSGFDAPFEDGARFPVDSAAALDEALAAFATPTGAVELTQPEVLPLVLAAPEPLSKTFAAVLDFLRRDARPNSPIRVTVEQSEQWVRYTFATTGFGLPPDRFRQLISPQEPVKATEFVALRSGLGRVRAWGGVVEADSVVGQGMSVSLCLPLFA